MRSLSNLKEKEKYLNLRILGWFKKKCRLV